MRLMMLDFLVYTYFHDVDIFLNSIVARRNDIPVS